ncbi:hypothetical protein [Methylobacterium komagatae]
MAGGWLPVASGQSGAQLAAQTFPAGDTRTWAVSVAKDLTGYSAEWRMGVPVSGALPSLLPVAYSPPEVVVLKASGANLAVITGTTSTLTWTTTYADTIGLDPAVYWHQAVVIDPQGNPTTVAEGRVTLTQSLRALQNNSASPALISPVVFESFAVWQGDNTPPQAWSFGPPNAPWDLTGSVMTLTLTGLLSPTTIVTLRSDTGDGNLVVDTTAQTLTWNYTSAQSAAIPPSGATYQIHRLINGTSQLWLHGNVAGVAP